MSPFFKELRKPLTCQKLLYMSEDLQHYRKAYEKGELIEENVSENPLQQFQSWFNEAKEHDLVDEVNAMTLSTLGIDGFPKGRVVLLKKYDENGFYFYTNYNSEKGNSIAVNNKVSLSFFWPGLERQIIIKGETTKTSAADSDNYFNIRPKGSQLGAAVSHQSTVIASRKVLENELKLLWEKYENSEVPRPKDWGGYLVRPMSIEFWQGRANRLHDRLRYTFQNNDWIMERLAP